MIWNTEGILTGPFNDVEQDSHVSEKSDFLTSPELCGSCYDVFNYPAIRIEESFTEYTSSRPIWKNTTCQDCHMSQTPGIPTEKVVGPIAEIAGMNPYPLVRCLHIDLLDLIILCWTIFPILMILKIGSCKWNNLKEPKNLLRNPYDI